MKEISLVAAVSVIVLANGFALAHVRMNRAGAPEAEVILTQKELRIANRIATNDDSSVSLNMATTGDLALNDDGLRKLGFDPDVDPAAEGAERFYARQRARRAFVALEYDGPAFQRWREDSRKEITQFPNSIDTTLSQSHLVPVDADLDPRALRARHPDRAKTVILPAVIAISFESALPRTPNRPGRPAQLRRYIREYPSIISVPLPFGDEFRRRDLSRDLEYRVHLRYGASLEPWVTGVQFTP